MNTQCSKTLFAAAFAGALLFANTGALAADGLPTIMQGKVDSYTKKLVDWAANPVIVAAVKEANAKGPGAMTNGKWNDLDEKDPAVMAYQTNKAGVIVGKWEDDKGINKLIVRDEKGNIVASSSKPLIFNNASRPAFANPIKGQAWSASEIKPDPTTGVRSVQAGAPVMDGGKVIGVIHAGISAE
ncbi:MAG TPA: hypothetical protein VIN38_04375 [Thiobacillus sp.]